MGVLRKFEAADAPRTKQFLRNINAAFRDILPHRVWRWIFFGALGRRIRPWEFKFTNFIPGVIEAIKTLHQKGCIIGICSSSESKRIIYWLKKEKIEPLIPCITSRDHRKIYGLKPSPGPLLGLLRIMKNHYGIRFFNRNRIAFVGDNVTDVLSAKRAKMKSIAVLSGHGFYRELKAVEPTFILESAAEIPNILPELFPDDFRTRG
jgi:phosphoglycolate phosphatase-like HAD superfamily hydrolase